MNCNCNEPDHQSGNALTVLCAWLQPCSVPNSVLICARLWSCTVIGVVCYVFCSTHLPYKECVPSAGYAEEQVCEGCHKQLQHAAYLQRIAWRVARVQAALDGTLVPYTVEMDDSTSMKAIRGAFYALQVALLASLHPSLAAFPSLGPLGLALSPLSVRLARKAIFKAFWGWKDMTKSRLT